MTRPVAVVLAGGLGTRMKSSLPKVLHPLCGRPMLAYMLDAARVATGSRPLVVTSPATARIREVFADDADFALQEAPLGTADAVRAAMAALPADVGEVVILNGDVPLVDPGVIGMLIGARRESDAAVALVSVDVDEPGGLGRVVRGSDGHVARIVEAKDAADHERALTEIARRQAILNAKEPVDSKKSGYPDR